MEGLNLSPVGLFLEAGLMGKFVMGILFIASLWCWVLIIEGVISVVRLRRAVRATRAGGEIAKPLASVATAGDEEVRRRIPGESVSDLRARVSDGMARAARELLTRSEGGLPNLAVISSVAPFIAAFGTVWRLMSSLADINATPLAGGMLVLLIIFRVGAPMLAAGIKVTLPSARTAQPLESKDPVVVVVAKDGAVSVGKDQVSRDRLAAAVRARLGDSN